MGIKDSSGDLTLTIEMIRQANDNFSVFMGRDTLIYAGLHHGAKGAIAATANAVPALAVEIYEAFLAGDLERSLKAQDRLTTLRQTFALGSFPVVIKDAMNMIGIPVGQARQPISSLKGKAREHLRAALEEIGALP